MSDLTEFAAHCRRMATAEHRPECCQCGRSWCCGCPGHPVGHPRGWSAGRWEEHAVKCPGNPSAPPCAGCVTDADRALFAALTAECEAYLNDGPGLFEEAR